MCLFGILVIKILIKIWKYQNNTLYLQYENNKTIKLCVNIDVIFAVVQCRTRLQLRYCVFRF